MAEAKKRFSGASSAVAIYKSNGSFLRKLRLKYKKDRAKTFGSLTKTIQAKPKNSPKSFERVFGKTFSNSKVFRKGERTYGKWQTAYSQLR